MNVVENGEVLDNMRELLVVILLRELDLAKECESARANTVWIFYLAHVKRADALDLVASMNHSRRAALGACKNNINEVLCRGHRVHRLEIVHRHLGKAAKLCLRRCS